MKISKSNWITALISLLCNPCIPYRFLHCFCFIYWQLTKFYWTQSQLYHSRTNYISIRWWWWWRLLVSDQHAEVDFYIASSLIQQSAGRHVPALCQIQDQSFLLHPVLLNAVWLAEKQQLCQSYSLWFNQTGVPTHNLLHSRQFC